MNGLCNYLMHIIGNIKRPYPALTYLYREKELFSLFFFINYKAIIHKYSSQIQHIHTMGIITNVRKLIDFYGNKFSLDHHLSLF